MRYLKSLIIVFTLSPVSRADEKAFATDLLPEEITILSKIRRGVHPYQKFIFFEMMK